MHSTTLSHDDKLPVNKMESSPDLDLESLLDYSRLNTASLNRGHLWLLPEEAEKINLLLKDLGSRFSFSFLEVPDVLHPPLPVTGKHRSVAGTSANKKSKKKSGSSAAPKRKSASTTLVPPRVTTAPVKTSVPSGEKEQLVQKVAKVPQSCLRNLPDWARRLHRILMLLCQSEIVRPFAPSPKPTDPDFGAYLDAIQPTLNPIGLSTVVSKLEHGSYHSPLDVFNDIYSVWLCAYRRHPPGSPLWLQAYEASKSFLQQVANEPVRDTFTPPVSPGTPSPNSASFDDEDLSSKNRGTPARLRRSSNTADVDKLLQEFLELHETGSQPRPEEQRRAPSSASVRTMPAASRVKRRSTSQGKRQARIVNPLNIAPITDEDRDAFQEYLSQLQAHHHLMLFEAFRRTAVWRSVESGEVELDDAKTSPSVFRKMIAWCRSQLAVTQQPPIKRQKVEAQSYSTAIAASPAVPHPVSDAGSGKILPGVKTSASGGKLAATSYIESRVPDPIGAVFSSSSNSSSSSSDDDGSSEDSDTEIENPSVLTQSQSSTHASAVNTVSALHSAHART